MNISTTTTTITTTNRTENVGAQTDGPVRADREAKEILDTSSLIAAITVLLILGSIIVYGSRNPRKEGRCCRTERNGKDSGTSADKPETRITASGGNNVDNENTTSGEGHINKTVGNTTSDTSSCTRLCGGSVACKCYSTNPSVCEYLDESQQHAAGDETLMKLEYMNGHFRNDVNLERIGKSSGSDYDVQNIECEAEQRATTWLKTVHDETVVKREETFV